ncbi:bacteriocin immunity protein [Pseudomonas corrugata]|uniref:bacteriocin immunity protein n=2 Tax=Pseudomonas TaxID=286 RepID=UPI0018E65627|nr:bacteriocin immunity protein [Pseudomonas corrugata]MBI6619272.1 bacteriocin immunity protein [Pseudomonas corrugata]MBI6694366.1 bacteriocin immunity protein [Pseudomonas corrugata]
MNHPPLNAPARSPCEQVRRQGRMVKKEKPKMELKPKLQDYTESEFQTLVDKIWSVEANREDHNRLINHFDLIVDHPDGADL